MGKLVFCSREKIPKFYYLLVQRMTNERNNSLDLVDCRLFSLNIGKIVIGIILTIMNKHAIPNIYIYIYIYIYPLISHCDLEPESMSGQPN